jgi:hypothetical protein
MLAVLATPPRYTTLHYLMQFQIIEASRVIAPMLLQDEARRTRNVLLKRVYSCCAVEQSYAGASQLALDMLLKVDAHVTKRNNGLAPFVRFLRLPFRQGDNSLTNPLNE